MSRRIDTTQYLDTACGLLASGRDHIPVPVSGTSMCPFLHPGDIVYLSPVPGRFRPGDIVLFRRSSGAYILHRIIKVGHGHTVLISGDNQTLLEAVDAPKQIVALVTSADRKGRHLTVKSPTWQFYRVIWRWLRPIRPVLGAIHNKLKAR